MFKHAIKYFSHSNNNDTIYALGTAVNGPINIIRISGPNSYKCLNLLSKSRKKQLQLNCKEALSKFKLIPRYAHLRVLYSSYQKMIDEGLVLYFPADSSYNKEEIYQLHVHGGKSIAALIFKQLDALGMRMAGRGQFTKRAVMNGRMSLWQAEAINDLVKSQSQFSRQVAINHLLGKNHHFIEKIKTDLIACLSKNEAYIDFQEEQIDVKESLFADTKQIVKKIIKDIQKVLTNYKNLQIVKDGLNVGVYGKTNVGKSSLVNKLAKKERYYPGTAIQIKTTIDIAGCKVNLYDTAGLRESTSSQVEAEGIKRAKNLIKQNHFNMLIIDWQQEHHIFEGNHLIIKLEKYTLIQNKQPIFIVNKIDLLPTNIKHIIISIEGNIITPIEISAEKEIGLINIQQEVANKINKDYQIYNHSQQVFFTRMSYFKQLRQCLDYLEKYIPQGRPDIACEELRSGIKSIQCIYGRVDNEDVLDVLFRDFCIGK